MIHIFEYRGPWVSYKVLKTPFIILNKVILEDDWSHITLPNSQKRDWIMFKDYPLDNFGEQGVPFINESIPRQKPI